MARRYGKRSDLWDEVMLFLGGLPYGEPLSRWNINDFLDGCRGNEFSQKEFEAVIARLETTYAIRIPQGSLEASIRCTTPGLLIKEITKKNEKKRKNYIFLSKRDELELKRTSA